LCEVGTGLNTIGWCDIDEAAALASLAGAKTLPCFEAGGCAGSSGGGDMGGENVIGELQRKFVLRLFGVLIIKKNIFA
jgi:hypothetical protein